MKNLDVKIGSRVVGPGHEPFVIAEMSANHQGSLERAMDIVQAAAKAGAHALKLQTYTADTLTIESEREEFQIKGGLWDGHSLHSLYQEAYTPWDWHAPLFARAKELGLLAFSSPFDLSAVAYLEELDVPAYKIASFELVDHGLIAACAATGKPVIMSTGLAAPEEVKEAVAVAQRHGAGGVVVLHCLSGYPSPPTEFNLRRLEALRSLTGVAVGISDHSLGATIPIAATALGACVIEKHLTLKRSDGGPDGAFSLEPHELAEVVAGSRTIWKALGSGEAKRADSESASRRYRRSLYVVEHIKEGESLTLDNVRSIRPSLGLEPKHLSAVLGKRAKRALPKGTPLAWALVAA
ncbi:MAG: pseudaminic acid synthase [Myxococcales bacterium]|nr:pseudaminic acid synthase [Myxococcales bacterium]